MQKITGSLKAAHGAFAARYPGESGRRQPVHTVYGGAHLFKSDTVVKLGSLAVRSLETFAPDAKTFAGAIGLPTEMADTIYERVLEKLNREAIEDFRIDFEDGYGTRPDEEEDGHTVLAAQEVAKGLENGTLPPFIGIRIKTFSEELYKRSIRTLDLFLTTLVKETNGRLPENFVVTLPKIVDAAQVSALADIFDALEPALDLPDKFIENGNDDRNDAIHHQRARRDRSAAAARSGARSLYRRAFRHLRLHGELQHHRRVSGYATPGVRFCA